MTVPFRSTRRIYPPRPKLSVSPDEIKKYEKKGWIGQRKFNGTRTLVYQTDIDEFELTTRHRTAHKQYVLTRDMKAALQALALGAGVHVLDGELMHSKTKGLKDTLVLWDILVHEDKYLVGTTYAERYKLLNDLLGRPKDYEQVTGHGLALHVVGNIWLAETFGAQLVKRFKEAKDVDEIEGLVLKSPAGELEQGTAENNNASWQVRCRKPHKNYRW